MQLKRLFYSSLFLIAFSSTRSFAQSCGTCSVVVSGYDTLAYTVSNGQTLCIDSSGIFEGTITLNGGTICNLGTFNPKTFSIGSGTINNYNLLRLGADVTLNSGLVLSNGPQSTARFEGNLLLSGGSLENGGITNVANTITFSSGSFSNSAIVNCQMLSGNNVSSIINSGVINQN